MDKTRPTRVTLPLYLLPIMIGLSGILFSRQFPTALTRSLVVLVSAGVSLFVTGNTIARLNIARGQRFILALGAVLLAVGGVVTLWDVSSSLELGGFPVEWAEVQEGVWTLSRWLGMLGLILGLVVLLYTLIRREEEVVELAGRFSSLAEQMNEGFILSTPEGVITLFNKKLLEMAGLQESDLLGEKAVEIAEKFNLRPILDEWEKRRQGIASQYEITWVANGQERRFWVSGSPIFDHRGRHAGTLATFRDVTEYHKMSHLIEEYAKGLENEVEERTRQLRLSEEKLRGLLLYMNEGFLTVDSSFRIQFANERIAAVLGVDSKTLIGRGLFDFVEPAGRARLLALFEAGGGQGEERINEEMTLVGADGRQVPVLVGVARLRSTEQETHDYSIVITDVTELKRMQQELVKRAEELEAANAELRLMDRAKDGFLTTVTHELRTPLSTIRGYVEMLESGAFGGLEGGQANALKVVSRNLNRLGALIEEVLDFSRMQIRGVELEFGLFAVEPLVEECAHSARPQLAEKNTLLHAEVPPDFPAVWGDRRRISQVVAILISNAVKFSPAGSQVKVRVAQRPGRTLALAVSDRGIGIDPVHHKRIFDKFYQVDGSLTRRYEGAGIGLSIAKAIAEAHGGLIEVESALGAGAAFTLLLPEALFVCDISEEIRAQIEGLRALVVDGDAGSRRALSAWLAACGLRVQETESSFAALRMAAETTPDLILLADELTDQSCLTILAQLREDEPTRGIPVMVMADRKRAPDLTPQVSRLAARLVVRPFPPEAMARGIIQLRRGEETQDARSGAGAVGKVEGSVLIVDPDADFAEWLATALRRRHIACYCASEPSSARESMDARIPSVVLLDVDSAEEPPDERIAAIRRLFGDSTPSMYAMTGLLRGPAGLEGVAGILRKPFKIQHVMDILSRAAGAVAGTQQRAP